MRQTPQTNLLHNPFFNRFNDPVTQRRDEMQSYENVRSDEARTNSSPVWSSISDSESTSIWNEVQLSRVGSIVAEAFALLLVLLVSVSMLKAF